MGKRTMGKGRPAAVAGGAIVTVVAAFVILAAVAALGLRYAWAEESGSAAAGESALDESVPDTEKGGGEDASVVQVANLVYARSKSSQCFADHFLLRAEQESTISTSRRFHAVKTASDELFEYPFVIMTGEGAFQLPKEERENLRTYLVNGGFLLASAGCSSKDWDKSFRQEMKKIFPETSLVPITFDHPVFHTVYDISSLQVRHGKPQPMEALAIDGRLAVVYSADGLNDTGHVKGCCCCGGNEIVNCEQVNVNVLAYALTF